MPDHLPAPDLAKRVDSASWDSARMLMPHSLACSQIAKLCTVRATENSTSGGSSDTELNELTVMPCSTPSEPRAVMMATPVGKVPSARRKSVDVKLMNLFRSLCRFRDIVGRQQMIYHAAGHGPIEGTVIVPIGDETRPRIEHFILGVARAEFRADGVPGRL